MRLRPFCETKNALPIFSLSKRTAMYITDLDFQLECGVQSFATAKPTLDHPMDHPEVTPLSMGTPSGKNKNAVPRPRPRGYPGAQVGHPACVWRATPSLQDGGSFWTFFPRVSPGAIFIGSLRERSNRYGGICDIPPFRKDTKGWASGLGGIWGWVRRKLRIV